jgi:O-antigen ligase
VRFRMCPEVSASGASRGPLRTGTPPPGPPAQLGDLASSPATNSRSARPPGAARTQPLVPAPLAAVAVGALLTFVALTPLAPFAADPYHTELRRHLVLGGVIAAYVLGLLIARRAPLRTALDLPLVAVLLAMAVGVAGSLDRRLSAEWVLVVLPVVPLFYLLADRRLLPAAALRWGVMIAGAVVAALAIRSAWSQWQDWLALVRAAEGGISRATLLPPSVPRVENVGSHPNIVGALLAIAAPLYLLPFTDGGRWRLPARVAAGTGLALLCAGLFFTLARSAWAAAVVGLAVTTAGLLAAGGHRPRRWQPWVVGAAVLLMLVAIGAAASGRARPDWLFRDSLNPRADMRRVGIEIFRDNPLTGAGPGTFVALYPRHHGAYPFAAVHSHNIAVQIAADYGLAGLAAAVLLLGATVVALVNRFRRGDAATRRLAAGGAGALAAFLVFGMADSPHLFPETLLFLAAAVAPLMTVRHGGATRRVAPIPTAVSVVIASPVPALLLLAVGVALLPAWRYTDRAAAAHERSVDAAAHNRWDEAVAAARTAASRDPHLAAYDLQLGAALVARYHARGDSTDRDAAITAYVHGLSLNPFNGAALADLAALRLDAGDTAGARKAIAALGAAAGRDSLLQLAYASLLQRVAPPDEAVNVYAGLLALDPTLALTPFWRDDDFRRTHFDAIVDRALVRAEEITGPGNAAGLQDAIRLFTGRDAPRVDELRATLAAAPGDVSLEIALGRLLTKDGRTVEAGPLLRDAAARKGDSADARAALGDWFAAIGDVRRARHEWLAAAYLGDVDAGDRLCASFAPGAPPARLLRLQRGLVDGVWSGQFYLTFQSFRFTFLRHEPVPIIGPGDWLDALPDDLPRWQADVQRWETAGRR